MFKEAYIYMTSTLKKDLVISPVFADFFASIDTLFIFADGELGGVTKLFVFCGRRKSMNANHKQ